MTTPPSTSLREVAAIAALRTQGITQEQLLRSSRRVRTELIKKRYQELLSILRKGVEA